MYNLSFISKGLKFWSVNCTSICENSESNVFEHIEFSFGRSNNWSNNLLRTNVYKTLVK